MEVCGEWLSLKFFSIAKEILELEKKLCRPVSCWSLNPQDSLDQERRLCSVMQAEL